MSTLGRRVRPCYNTRAACCGSLRGTTLRDRTILPDCCEDWVLEYGRFYEVGDGFACPECATVWQKANVDQFVRDVDGRQFIRRVRSHEGAEFPYLTAADGAEPITERCCARIILRHHQTIRLGEFLCPVCRTLWRKETRARGGVSVPVFVRPGLSEPIAVQPGPRRAFLVPLATYTLPVE